MRHRTMLFMRNKMKKTQLAGPHLVPGELPQLLEVIAMVIHIENTGWWSFSTIFCSLVPICVA